MRLVFFTLPGLIVRFNWRFPIGTHRSSASHACNRAADHFIVQPCPHAVGVVIDRAVFTNTKMLCRLDGVNVGAEEQEFPTILALLMLDHLFNTGAIISFGASLLALCDRLVIYGDRISSGMKEEIRRARELGIPILNRQTQLSDGSSDPVIVGRYINGISLNGLEYLKNDADEVIYFAGVEAAKVYLREHGVTEDEMEDMVFRKSVGTCFRCGDPLFLSDIPEYTCQCFRCDEDFYSIEQDVDL